MVTKEQDEMSSSNYGDKNLRIKIPIEIVPEDEGIDEKTRELSTRQRIEKGRMEARRRIFDEEHPEDAFPRWSQPALKGGGGLREYSAEYKNLTKLVSGITATEFRLGYVQPKLAGTANVPQGGQAPQGIAKKDFKKTTTSPQEEQSFAEKIFEKLLGGPAKARQGISFLQNPQSGLVKLLQTVGGAGAGIAVGAGVGMAAIALMLVKLMVAKGSIFDKTFRNIIDTRMEILRTRELQQRHRIGFGKLAQLITTTNAGTTNPRDSFNTYTEFNEENSEFEYGFQIRDNQGVI